MPKKQKVRFHRGDKRPGTHQFTLSYTKKMIKKRKNIYWQVIEKPTKNVVWEGFFEEDAHKIKIRFGKSTVAYQNFYGQEFSYINIINN